MNLTEWAKAQGVHPQTAYRWFREGTLPVPAQRVGPRTILVNVEVNAAPEAVRQWGRREFRPVSGPPDAVAPREAAGRTVSEISSASAAAVTGTP